MSGEFVGLFTKVQKAIDRSVKGLFGRYPVSDVGDGTVEIDVIDTETGNVIRDETVPVLRRGPIVPGDRVLVLNALGGKIALGAIGGDQFGNDDMDLTIDALSDPDFDGGASQLPFLTRRIRQLYFWNGVRAFRSTVSDNRVVVELDWAGLGGDFGTDFHPSRHDHGHSTEQLEAPMLNLLGYVDPTRGGFGMSGISPDTSNDTALENAMATGKPVRIPEGLYPARNVTVPNGAILEFAPGARLIRGHDSVGTPVLNCDGSAAAAVTLSANAALGATSVQTATNPNLSPGDVVYLLSDRDPWTSTTNRPDRDVLRVEEVTGSGPYTVHLAGMLAHALTAATNARLQKVNANTVRLINPTIIGLGGGQQFDGIGMYWNDGSVVESPSITDWKHYGLRIFGSIDVRVDNPDLRNSLAQTAGEGYGIGFGDGSRGCLVTDIVAELCRTGVVVTSGASYTTVRGGNTYACMQDFNTHGNESRGCIFIDLTAHGSKGNAFGSGNPSFGADFDTTFVRCRVPQAVAGTSGVFKSENGATGTKLIDCEAVGGAITVQIDDSDDCVVQGGRFEGASNTIIHFIDAIGGQVLGARIANSAGWGLRSTGTSNFIMHAGNQFVNNPTDVALIGANNVDGGNLIR